MKKGCTCFIIIKTVFTRKNFLSSSNRPTTGSLSSSWKFIYIGKIVVCSLYILFYVYYIAISMYDFIYVYIVLTYIYVYGSRTDVSKSLEYIVLQNTVY